MSWYRYSDGESPLYRLPLTIEFTAGGSVNWTFSLAGIKDVDAFWSAIQSDAYDVRVTEADGTIIGPTAWDINGFSRANRTGTIRVQAHTIGAGIPLLWLYFGKPTQDASSPWVGTPVPSSPKTVHLHRVDPSKLDPARVIGGANRAQSRGTRPRADLRKGVAESIRIYFLFDGFRRTRVMESQGRDLLDVPVYASHDVTDGNGSGIGTMYTSTDGRYAVDSAGNLYYSMIVKAGTDATKYTARCLITTDEGEIIQYTCGVAVRDTFAA